MANLSIFSSQDDVELGEKVSLIASVGGASPGSVVSVDIQADGVSWPATVHVNPLGSGGAVSSDVMLPGAPGVVTHVVLTATATSNEPAELFAPATTTVRVHG